MSNKDIQRYGSSGAFTVEGNAGGNVSAMYNKERDKQVEAFLTQKQKIQNTKPGIISKTKFQVHQDSHDVEFKRQTIGLQSSEEFKRKRKLADEAARDGEKEDSLEKLRKIEKLRSKKLKKRNKKRGPMSFSIDEDSPGQKMVKNPNVNTEFLPDKQRDLDQAAAKLKHQIQYEEQQKVIKEQSLDIKFTYWDGSKQIFIIAVQYKLSIASVLGEMKMQLCTSFPALKNAKVDTLMFVHDAKILPHSLTLYDLKMRQNDEPLFDEPIKIVQQEWYRENKHIFPINQWIVFDPTQQPNDDLKK